MTPAQQLYQEPIYALNRILGRELEQWLYEGRPPERPPLIVCTLFNKRSRTFHWLAVHPGRWAFGPGFQPNDLLKISADNQAGWEVFCRNAEQGGLQQITAAVNRVRAFIAKPQVLSEEDQAQL